MTDKMLRDEYLLGIELQARDYAAAQRYRRSYQVIVMALAVSVILNIALIFWK